MEKNLLSSLIPFISDEEITYYAQLSDDVISQLTSLAPFAGNPQNLRKLSKLTVEQLEKAAEILPTINAEEKEIYFNKL